MSELLNFRFTKFRPYNSTVYQHLWYWPRSSMSFFKVIYRSSDIQNMAPGLYTKVHCFGTSTLWSSPQAMTYCHRLIMVQTRLNPRTSLATFLLSSVNTAGWRMMTSSMETFSALLDLCAGNSPVTGEFPSQRPVMQSFDVFFDLRLNKRPSKQSWRRRFETPLWRHCNGIRHHARSPSVLSDVEYQPSADCLALLRPQRRSSSKPSASLPRTLKIRHYWFIGLY